MESLNACDALLNIVNDIILHNDLNIQTDNINQIKIFYASEIPFNNSNEYVIASLIQMIESKNEYIDEYRISILLNRLNELLRIFENHRVDQNIYQLLYQFIQYLNNMRHYGVNSSTLQLPPPVITQSNSGNQCQLMFEPPHTEVQFVDNSGGNRKNKCASCCMQSICISFSIVVAIIVAIGLFIFGAWLYHAFH